jgi:fatty-acyl-CoA synthase
MEGLMMDDYPLTLTPLLERAERLFPTVRIATRAPDRSVRTTDYATVARRARTLAAALRESGVNAGDRVGTLMWNQSTHLEAYLGVPAAGAVLHTLNLRLPPDHLAYVINHAKDRWILVDDVLLPVLAKVRERIHPERVFVVPFSGQKVPEGFEDYEGLLASHRPATALPSLSERDAAGLCYTSGTTGRLKGVLYSHRSIVLHSFAEAVGIGLTQSDAVLVVVPMFHVNAWGLPFTLTMLGARQVLPGPHLDAESLVDLIARERVTLAAGVPSIWLGILEAIEKNPGRWTLDPNLRMVIGGSAVPESMVRRFAKLGIRVIQGYGMTETTPVVSLSLPKAEMRDWEPERLYPLQARQGLPLPFADVRLRNEAGDLPWDGKSVGELQLRGPWVARQYYEDPDTQGKWTDDGWLRTGDVATIDPEGFIEVVDRLKDLVKSGGEWISSVALENALVGHPGVREAAVIAVPHPKWGERPIAFVVAREGVTLSEPELRGLLEEKYPKWWIPDEFRFVPTLPKTSTGKISKLTLREELARAPEPSRPPP